MPSTFVNQLYTLFLLCSTLILTSCGDGKKLEISESHAQETLVISSSEEEGIKEILEIYAGKCTYGVGSLETEKENASAYFQLEVTESDAVDDFVKTPELPASNIAYLFYKNLSEKDKSQYSEIHTVLHPWGGNKARYRYPAEQLERVEQRMDVVKKVVESLKSHRIMDIRPMLNNDLFGYDKDALIKEIETTEPQLGNISEFLTYGYTISITDTGQEILHVSGALIRDIENNGFSIDLDLNSDEEEILFLQYRL